MALHLEDVSVNADAMAVDVIDLEGHIQSFAHGAQTVADAHVGRVTPPAPALLTT